VNSAEATWFRRVAASQPTDDPRVQDVIAEVYDLTGGPRTLRAHVDEDLPSVEILSIERTPPDDVA
jgi:hypothetical protein